MWFQHGCHPRVEHPYVSLSLRHHAHGPLMHTAHSSGNIFGSYEVFIGLVKLYRISRKPPHERRKPLFTSVTTSAYQDQLNAGYSKVCEKCKVRGIESLKYVWEFYTPVYYCDDISTPRNVMQHKMKRDWLLYLSVISSKMYLNIYQNIVAMWK